MSVIHGRRRLARSSSDIQDRRARGNNVFPREQNPSEVQRNNRREEARSVALPDARGAERAHVEFGEDCVQGFAHVAFNHAPYLLHVRGTSQGRCHRSGRSAIGQDYETATDGLSRLLAAGLGPISV